MEPIVHLTPSCGLKGKLIPKPTSTEEEGRDVYNFLGIPYAEPPVGSLRFCDPKPAPLWSGVRSATEFGASCPQDFSILEALPLPVPKPDKVSEDCLFLNIWTPSLDSGARLPVMVWIYGGGFLSGVSDLYDMKALACFHNVVVVTFNYRVASLGFLCVNDDAAAGNFGIMDQIEVLKWVQKHISHFGGDPDNVTLFGESAGSMSVSLLTISPLAKGLFKRAIAESGTVFSGNFGCVPSETSFKRTIAYMEKTMEGCPPSTASGSEIVDYLRKLPADELVAKFKDNFFTPVVDGRVFPAATTQLYERGEFNPCDLLVGCNSDEGETFFEQFMKKMGLPAEKLNFFIAQKVITNIIAMMWTAPNGEQVYKAIVDEYLKEGIEYTTEDLRRAMAESIGDLLFAFATIKAANCHSRKCKTYVYHFCHRPPLANCPSYARADHGVELFYTLRVLGFGLGFNADDEKLSRQMATYWTNFARTGNPNAEGLEEWPEYNETTRRHLVLELPPRSESNMKESRADFWLNQLPKIINS